MIPTSDPRRRFQNTELIDLLNNFVKTGPYLNGQEVEKFEKEFASFLGVKECIGVSSGTTALELALLALQLPIDSAVLVPANAGGYASIAAKKCGLRCEYYEVNHQGLPSRDLLEACCSSNPKAVIITHLYGQSANISDIREWTKQNRIFLIEDCAQSAGAMHQNRYVGSYGDLSTFSFYPTKNLGTIGDAGAVCTNNLQLAEMVRSCRQYGWKERYNSIFPGLNGRMDEVHALVLRYQLKSLLAYNSRRRYIWKSYRMVLKEYGLESILIGQDDESFVAHLGVIRVENRENVRASLLESGISSDIHYPIPDYRQPSFFQDVPKQLTNTELLCKTVLSIPLFESMTDLEIEKVCSSLRNICARGEISL